MLKILSIFILLFGSISCHRNISPPIKKAKVADSTVQFLLDATAKDFSTHAPPTVISFRNVRAGFTASGKDTLFLLCGDFLVKESGAWETFTTIRTSDYELYIGGNDYCRKARFTNTDTAALSASLRSLFEKKQ